MIFLDTDVLIALLRGDASVMEAIQRAQAAGEEAATTSINAGEFRRGVEGHGRRTAALGLLARLVEVPYGPKAARRFGQLMWDLDRKGRPLASADGMIAATVLESGGRLLTRNMRDFERVPGLIVETP